jgi:hypothetical protein
MTSSQIVIALNDEEDNHGRSIILFTCFTFPSLEESMHSGPIVAYLIPLV